MNWGIYFAALETRICWRFDIPNMWVITSKLGHVPSHQATKPHELCTAQILIHYEKGVPPTSEELAKKLESKKDHNGPTDQPTNRRVL